MPNLNSFWIRGIRNALDVVAGNRIVSFLVVFKSFSHCSALSSISFEADSEFARLESNLFSCSRLKSIAIRWHVQFIDGSTFLNAPKNPNLIASASWRRGATSVLRSGPTCCCEPEGVRVDCRRHSSRDGGIYGSLKSPLDFAAPIHRRGHRRGCSW
jgi:hypothetical protein